MNSGVIFLDLKKAFDTVDDMLSFLKKLSDYGLQGLFISPTLVSYLH